MGRGVGGFAIRLSCSVTPGLVGGGPTGRWAPASPTCPATGACARPTTHPCTPTLAHPSAVAHWFTIAHLPLHIYPCTSAHGCTPTLARLRLHAHPCTPLHHCTPIWHCTSVCCCTLICHCTPTLAPLPLYTHPCTSVLSLNLLSKSRNPVQEKVYKSHLMYSETNSCCLWYPSIIWDPSMWKESSLLEPFLLFAVPLKSPTCLLVEGLITARTVSSSGSYQEKAGHELQTPSDEADREAGDWQRAKPERGTHRVPSSPCTTTAGMRCPHHVHWHGGLLTQ